MNSKIFSLFVNGLSNRRIGRFLGLSPHSVRIRLTRMSQRALEFHYNATRGLVIDEPICFDGLENFAVSQYEPNNINQALGRDSLFIYGYNFAPLNRKGRMSKWQKLKLAEMVKRQGRFNPQAIRVAIKDLIKELYSKRKDSGTLTLVSDQHFQYRRAIQLDLKELNVEHVTISSKATRNYQNILFSVNHADLLIRKSIASFARETIAFSKTHGQMCQKFALFMVHKNYMIPQFTKPQVRRVNADTESPAQKLGLCNRILEFSEVFLNRSLRESVKEMSEDWQAFWHARVPEKYHRDLKYAR